MNEIKRDSILRSMAGNVRRIYESVPIDEPQNAPAIAAEMRRIGTGGTDSRHILGCLETLRGYGLVVETTKGLFKRAEVHTKAEKPKIKKEEIVMTKPPEVKKPEATPIERLSSFAVRLRALADEMENTALDLAEKAEKNEAETAKMRQLQAILKSLG